MTIEYRPGALLRYRGDVVSDGTTIDFSSDFKTSDEGSGVDLSDQRLVLLVIRNESTDKYVQVRLDGTDTMFFTLGPGQGRDMVGYRTDVALEFVATEDTCTVYMEAHRG